MTPPDSPRLDTRVPVYRRWVTSWEAALAALTNALRTGALTPQEAARHRTAIATERDLVIRQLQLLAGGPGAAVVGREA